MFGLRTCIVLFVGLSATNIEANSTIDTYKMHEKCGETINMKWKSIYTAEIAFDFEIEDDFPSTVPKVAARHGNQYEFPVMCELFIESWSFLDRIMIQFKNLQIGSGCDNTSIEILDGPSADSPPVKGLPPSICKHHIDRVMSVPYMTSDKHLTLRVHGNKQLTNNVRFTMILVAFHEGNCRSYEHTCASGRCIMDDLVCNGHNPCGDNSDCLTNDNAPREVKTEESTALVIALIAISTTIAVLLIGALIFCVSYRHRKKLMRQQQYSSSFNEPRHQGRPTTSVTFQVERSISQIEAERRLAPPSYSTLPASQETDEDCDLDRDFSQLSGDANTEENENELDPCFTADNNNPPSYACVMLNKDGFKLSSNEIEKTGSEGSAGS